MRKKIIGILICMIFIANTSAVLGIPEETENTSEKVSLSFSQPILTNENEHISIVLNEANSFLMEEGKPMLPSYTETFTFPFGTHIKSVTVTPQNIQLLTISKDIVQTPQRFIVGQNVKTSREGIKNYGTELYPSKWFEYRISCGLYKGELSVIVNVQIYPIKYHPIEKIIEWAKEVYVVIEYEPSTPQLSYRDNYQLVVIGSSEYSGQVAPLITHKIGKGITSKFVSLNEIYNGAYFPTQGRDEAEKVKYFIKNAIENWGTKNILLVGNRFMFPVRETHIKVSSDDQEIFVSDLYFADIYDETSSFASWDSNNNSIFAEYKWINGSTDKMDLNPDVTIGRIPCNNDNELTIIVNKIINYENQDAYTQDWFNKLIAIGGDSFIDEQNDENGILEGEFVNDYVINIMDGFNAERLWASNDILARIIPSGVTSITDSINLGCGFIDFSGHGNTDVWSTHPHNNSNKWLPTPFGQYHSSNINDLSNGDKLPIIITAACSVSKFSKDQTCFSYTWLSNENGGGIASFGATGLGYAYIAEYVVEGLIEGIAIETFRSYREQGAITLGEMWCWTIENYMMTHRINDGGEYKTVLEWQLFGDPTLSIAAESNSPEKPQPPTGPSEGKIKEGHTYKATGNDPDSDKIYYLFDWGDGTYSGWIGPKNSGEMISANHTWVTKGSYQVKVAVKDVHGKQSEWSDPLPITMPYSYDPMHQFFEWLFERFPHAFPILRHLLGY
jgi:hypothetical protein